ncbi:acyl-CoA thioesterase [Lysinibacillus sp. 54212]|uniref:acyl-CoA thioesterase n=1 Tax=Lysinibacillus sp. 54212 TaxID=3119829 RepID=UPI002FC97A78
MKASYMEDTLNKVSEFKFSVGVQVRFSETDMFGHLNNTVTFTYFEFARIEYLKSLGLMTNWQQEEVQNILVVADLQCDYLKQVFFDEKLEIYVRTARIGTSSIDLHYLAKNEKDEPVFTGRGTVVQINRHSGKGAAWTEDEKQLLHGK